MSRVVALLVCLLLAAICSTVAQTGSTPAGGESGRSGEAEFPACWDGVDNDGDGWVDYPEDGGCESPIDTNEQVWYDYFFTPSEGQENINWDLFGVISLPARFTLVYQGPHLGDTTHGPLRNGFTHISQKGTAAPELLDPSQRAVLWTGVAGSSGGNYPWRDIKSPWPDPGWVDYDEDPSTWETILEAHYYGYWQNYMDNYAEDFGDTGSVPDVGIMCADIERHLSHDSILSIRVDDEGLPINEDRIPASVYSLPDEEFIDRYQRDMAKMYTQPLEFLEEIGFAGQVTSYADVPVRRTWWTIDDYDWEQWRSDRSLISYLHGDYTQPGEGFSNEYGPFWDHLDLLTPSAYVFYNYPDRREGNENAWDRSGDYLAYLLFQVEANQAWNTEGKPVVLYLWMLYHSGSEPGSPSLRPHQAHAMAIFPFLSGADGVWLWDSINFGMPPEEDPNRYAIYEHYFYGLSRLAEHGGLLEGDAVVHIPEPARDSMVGNHPVWRGVINDGQMLVAAHNPYAQHERGEVTTIDIDYGGHPIATIQVDGLNTFLDVFDLPFDCDPGNDTVWLPASEVRSLKFENDKMTLRWEEPRYPGGVPASIRYDTVRTASASDWAAAASCIETGDGQDRIAIDPAAPVAGQAWYYLVRAVNDCPGGEGDAGTDSAGNPRTVRSCP